MNLDRYEEFLSRVDREILATRGRRIAVRDHLRVRRLAQSPLHRTRESLRDALASLLSTDQDQWYEIQQCFEDCFPINEARIPSSLLTRPDNSLTVQPPGRIRFNPLFSLRLHGLLLAVSVFAAICLKSWSTYRALPPPLPIKIESPQGVKHTALNAELEARKTVRITEITPQRIITTTVAAPLRPRILYLWSSLSFVLFLFGWRLVGLPRFVRRSQALAKRQIRAELAEAELQYGDALRPVYHVAPQLPVGRAAAEDAANVLGRIHRQDPGEELDIGLTLQETLRSGGRMVPVFQPRRAPSEVIVLIDYERGDHPWLGGFLALLELWQAMRVRLRLYRFAASPHSLDELPSNRKLFLEQLARGQPGAPLLIFSRELTAEANWLTALQGFGARAWLDPDPRPPEQRSESRRRTIRRLKEAGLCQFPLTAAGLVSLGRHLQASRSSIAPVWPPLPDDRDTEVKEAVQRWAVAAALVPDAGWDQLQALREALPEIREVLSEPRHLQLLLDFVAKRPGEQPEREMKILWLSDMLQEQLIMWLRSWDTAPNTDGSFERRVHQVLLEQLGKTQPSKEGSSEYGRLIYQFKRTCHESLINPLGDSIERLKSMSKTGIGHLVEAFLRQELTRQDKGCQNLFPEKNYKELKALINTSARIGIRDLFVSQNALWVRSAVAAVLCGALMLATLWIAPKLMWLGPRLHSEHQQETEFPATRRVERSE